jgi:hypothetical protein
MSNRARERLLIFSSMKLKCCRFCALLLTLTVAAGAFLDEDVRSVRSRFFQPHLSARDTLSRLKGFGLCFRV